jgi:hypothetical protein
MPGTPTPGYMILRPAKEKRAAEKEKGEERPTNNPCDEATTDAIVAIIAEARFAISQINTRTLAIVTTKEKVVGMLSNAILLCNKLGKNLDNSAANITTKTIYPQPNSRDIEPSKDTRRFEKLENDMTDIKSNMAELKELMLGTANTYAQAAATNIINSDLTNKPARKQSQAVNQPTKEKQREARQPYEVKLTNQHMPDPTKKEFAEMHNKGCHQKTTSNN